MSQLPPLPDLPARRRRVVYNESKGYECDMWAEEAVKEYATAYAEQALEDFRAALAITHETGNSATAPASGITSQSGDLKQAAELMRLIDEYARAYATAWCENLYGTSKSYTKECERDRDEAAEAIRAALAAEPSPCQFAIDAGGNLYRRYSAPVCSSCVPAAKITDKWESCRVADFNAGWNACREAFAAPAAPAVPDGWRLVPAEPTPEMLEAMQSSGWMPGNYRALLSAAPTPSQTATHAPAAVPLTDEQIGAIVREASRGAAIKRDGSTSLRIARAIEKAHGIAAVPQCKCGDRPASQCDEEWGPNCDLGNNPAHVRVYQEPQR